jgi:hypothetical protein
VLDRIQTDRPLSDSWRGPAVVIDDRIAPVAVDDQLGARVSGWETAGAPHERSARLILESGDLRIHSGMRADAVCGHVGLAQALEEAQMLRRDLFEEHIVGKREAAFVELPPGARGGLAQRLRGFVGIALDPVERFHAKQPRMAAIVVERPEKPLLVIAEQAHDLGLDLRARRSSAP